MSRLPFVKPKPAPLVPQLMLPAPHVTRTVIDASRPRHGVSSHFRAPPIPGLTALDVRQPWKTAIEPSKAYVLPTTLTLGQVTAEYAIAYPTKPAASPLELILWLYQRAQDAESDKLLLEQEIQSLDGRLTDAERDNQALTREVANLEKGVRDLQVEINIMHSHGI